MLGSVVTVVNWGGLISSISVYVEEVVGIQVHLMADVQTTVHDITIPLVTWCVFQLQ